MPHESLSPVMRRNEPRLHELDSLRGIAALTVVLCHFDMAMNASPTLILPPGHSAVVLFFLLSGYVLSIPYWNGRQGSYTQYILRRFFRIYVPYAAAVCIALIGAMNLNGAVLPLSWWFYLTWHAPVTWPLIAAQFFQMSTSPQINTAFWSLRYEMEASLVFPLIISLILFLRGRGTLMVACICALVGQSIAHLHKTDDLIHEMGTTFLWGSCFILGALISWKAEGITVVFRRIPSPIKFLLALVACTTYFIQKNVIIIPSALLIIVLVENTRAKIWLQAFPLRYLGRISYSLYLTHATVLFAILILTYGKIPTWLLFSVFLAISVGIAHLFCIWVEEPSMRIGKRLIRHGWGMRVPLASASDNERSLITWR